MNENERFELIYSPRTTISIKKDKEEKIFNDLKIGFDPYTIKIMKKHYKEHLGKLNKETFISILKRHLLTWHPNLPNREEILIKLLSRLFDEIDLNSNGDLEWDEFVNYIINSSYHQNYENSLYALQQYSLSKETIDHQDNNNINESKFNYMSNKNENIISHCFYMSKYKIIGVVHEGKSRILFFNAENNKRNNLLIDLKDTQKEIDELEIKELNHKSMIKLEKERLDKIEKQIYYNQENLSRLKIDSYINAKKNPIFQRGRNSLKKNIRNNNSLNINKNLYNNNSSLKKSSNNRPETPESIRNEINKINETDKKKKRKRKDVNEGIFALTTCFVEQYDVLFISTSNNKISAWYYNNRSDEFKNANLINYKYKTDFHFEYNRIQVPLFSPKSPQNTMCFDYTLKCLYSGQENGKILKWDMDSPNYTYVFDIYEEKNKNIINSLSSTKLDYIEINGINADNRSNKSKELLSLVRNQTYNSYGEKKSGKDLDREKEQFYKVENNTKSISSFKHKRDTVSCLLMLERLRLICSSFYNGQIILWDATTKKPQKVFNDQMTGIYNMAFDPNKNQIFTCGFEHEIFVYEPYNNTNAVYKLKGHNGSINSLAINPALNELISIDVLGIIKIWDTNLFSNFQTINTNDALLLEQNHIKKPNEINSLTNKKKITSNIFILSYQNLKKFLVYGSKLLMYEKGKDKNPNLTDDYPLLGCVYNNLSKDLITFSNKKIKIWNIFTGKVKKSYEDLMKGNEITTFTCDKQMKRFYLGDNGGHIKGFNMSTGDSLKDYFQHENEIVNVIHSSKYELLISCSSDLCIKFQDDKELLSTELIKEIYARPGNILYYGNDFILKLKNTILDEKNGILMIGLSNGDIMHYDVGHYKFFLNPNEEQEIKLSSKQIPISCLSDIDEIDLIFVGYDNGEKCFTAKAKNKYYHYLAGEKFGNFEDDIIIDNYDTNDNNLKKRNIIISSAYNHSSHSLCTGDHNGIICCYDLMPLINFMKTDYDGKSEDEIKAIFHKSVRINLKYRVQMHNEAIKYLCVPDELVPKIIISTSNDKTVKLLDFYTGAYIDTLKQISIKYNSIPIGIKYLKDNPFVMNEISKNNESKSKENNTPNFNVIYKEDITGPIEIPKINYDEANHNDIVAYYDEISEYNAKIQLLSTSKGQKISSHKSNPWNYDVNVQLLLEKNEKEVKELINIVNQKESETNQAEKQHQQLSIFHNNYNPVFIDNLDRDEKYELKNQINAKIRNINLAISKSIMLQKEMEVIEKFRKIHKNRGIDEDDENNKKNLPKIKKRKVVSRYKDIYNSRYPKISYSQVNILNLNDNNKINSTINYDNNKFAPITSKKLQMPASNEKSNINSVNNAKKKIINFEKKNKLQRNSIHSIHRASSYIDLYNNNKNLPFADKRFKICKNTFEEKFKELTVPFEILFRNNNRNTNKLPKIIKFNGLNEK
jgi:hypothetical protein